MSMSRDVEEYADAKVQATLVKLQRLFEMMLTQTEDRDAATLAQRQGTPMPPELISLWTDALWASTCPTMPEEAKDETRRFIEAKFHPRMGLYVKQMIPVEDMMRAYLQDEVEVMRRKPTGERTKKPDEQEITASASEIRAAIKELQEKLEEMKETSKEHDDTR